MEDASLRPVLHGVFLLFSTVPMYFCRGNMPLWCTTRTANRPLPPETRVGVRPCTIPSMTTTA